MDFLYAMIIGLIVFVTILAGTFLDSLFLGYPYNANIGSYFDLSDKASKLDTKLDYLKQYSNALVESGLNEGQSTVFFQTKETSLEENYKVLQSLIERMEETKEMEINSFEYQTAIKQITEDEYCWFHTDVFVSGYYIDNGRW